MEIPQKLRDEIHRKHGSALRSEAHPKLLDQIIDEIADALATRLPQSPGRALQRPPSLFNVDWMDSFVAHWVAGEVITVDPRIRDLERVLNELVDLRFDQRLGEIRDFIQKQRLNGGSPEPGEPPRGPSESTNGGPPDGGPPEPGVPPAGPSGPSTFEPPDAGPPEPGVPPTGPDAGFLTENPWILYWFVSLKAPLLLDMVDAHLEQRLGELGFERR